MSRSIALVRCTGSNLTPVSDWTSLSKLNATIAGSKKERLVHTKISQFS